jgi:hypothetical protein
MEAPAGLDEGSPRRADSPNRALQASIPGVYAWAVTVAGSAFGRGIPWTATVTGLLAPLLLLGGVPAGARWGPRVRDASLWAFVLACAATWGSAPASLGPRYFDLGRAAAGVLGWGLFALAWAAPPIAPVNPDLPSRREPAMIARRRLPRGDAAYLAFGAIAAVAMQLIGWEVVQPERALLVRLVTLATGIGVLGAVAEVASARHTVRPTRPAKIGLLRAIAIGAVLTAIALGGLLMARGD